VAVFTSTATPMLIRNFTAFSNSTGGSFVSVADANADGRGDIIVAGGIGDDSRVRIFDSATGNSFDDFLAYNTAYRGGANVAGIRRA
jgi:WD40 repeat protein